MSLADVLDRAAGGGRITLDEGIRLYRDAPLHELGAAAHARRMAMYPGNDVTYVVDTTNNYTNVCNVHCTFCAFFRPEKHGEGYTMSHDTVLERVRHAADQGATQIMIQGGVNPAAAGVVRALFGGSRPSFRGSTSIAVGLGDRGLAKIEDLTVREVFVGSRRPASNRCRAPARRSSWSACASGSARARSSPDGWLGVMREAQQLGMPTTATMMFGSIETDAERIEHLDVIRDLQDETVGFTAFIPWYYVPHKTPLRGGRRPASSTCACWPSPGSTSTTCPPSVVVADARPQTRPARAVLRLRRHGRTIIEDRSCTTRAAPMRRPRGSNRYLRRRFRPVVRDTYWNGVTTWNS